MVITLYKELQGDCIVVNFVNVRTDTVKGCDNILLSILSVVKEILINQVLQDWFRNIENFQEKLWTRSIS